MCITQIILNRPAWVAALIHLMQIAYIRLERSCTFETFNFVTLRDLT